MSFNPIAFSDDIASSYIFLNGFNFFVLSKMLKLDSTIFFNFKGGKGVATTLGMVLALHPMAALVSIVVFLIVFGISHYVSLGSMVASIVFPLLLTFGVFGEEIPTLIYFGYFIAFLVVFTHRMNIVRIFKGTENRMYLIPSKK